MSRAIPEVCINDLTYSRDGVNRIRFTAKYDGYWRRGTVIYDTLRKQFCSHNSDIQLLAAICKSLGSYGTGKAFS
jgi:hypothetical protein